MVLLPGQHIFFHYMPSAGDEAISSSSLSYVHISSLLDFTLFISQKSVCPDTKAWAFNFCQCLHFFFFIRLQELPAMLKNSLERPNAPTSHAWKRDGLMPFQNSKVSHDNSQNGFLGNISYRLCCSQLPSYCTSASMNLSYLRSASLYCSCFILCVVYLQFQYFCRF